MLPRTSFASTLSGIVALTLLALLSAPVRADKPIKADSGKFVLIINGKELGTDVFTVTADGGSTGVSKIAMNGQSLTLKNTLKAVKNRLTELAMTAEPGGHYTITLNGTKGKFKGEGGGQKTEKDILLAPRSYPFGNYMPHLLVNVLAAYDLGKGGTQPVALLLAENGIDMTANLSARGEKTYTVKGKPVKASRYTLSDLGNPAITPQKVTLEILADSDRRVLLWYVPTQKYLAVRDGYQEMMKAAQADLSK